MSIDGLVSITGTSGTLAAGAALTGLAGVGFFAATAFLVAGFFAAGLLWTGFLEAERFTAGRFRTTFFRVTAFKTGFFAAIFLAETALADFLAAARFAVVPLGADLRAGVRDEAALRDAIFVALTFVLTALVRAVFARGFGRGALASPRTALPGFRAFAVVARRVGLLREVEAMGTTLGTVETWFAGWCQATQFE
jgi:hypothetical protein